MRDSGIGMSAAQRQRLFQPFDRLGRERSDVPGTGIGLVLTRELIEAMGGALEVRTQEGRGSEFTFALPAAAARTEPPPAPSALVRRPEVRGHVLAVEDDPVNAVLLHGVFARRPSITLEVAATGSAALAAARRRTPDLLLLDLHLPDRPGLDVLRELRERDELAVPCIVVSGSSLPADAGAARAACAQAFLRKPLDVDTLLATVDSLLPSD
ncbi:MAG: response regulator [Comamonadaceae bacterium]|nr:response regulator [Comamonadaceae bacterium]